MNCHKNKQKWWAYNRLDVRTRRRREIWEKSFNRLLEEPLPLSMTSRPKPPPPRELSYGFSNRSINIVTIVLIIIVLTMISLAAIGYVVGAEHG